MGAGGSQVGGACPDASPEETLQGGTPLGGKRPEGRHRKGIGRETWDACQGGRHRVETGPEESRVGHREERLLEGRRQEGRHQGGKRQGADHQQPGVRRERRVYAKALVENDDSFKNLLAMRENLQ